MKEEVLIKLQKMLHETFLLLNGVNVKGYDNISGLLNSMANIQAMSREVAKLSDNQESDNVLEGDEEE